MSPGDSFRHAAVEAMLPHVRRLLELEPALRQTEATDDVKRYRVATRRLRAAFRAFDGALPNRAVRDILPGLGDLARIVGRVRDLDVRIAGLVAWAADRGGAAPEAVEPLRAAWDAERARSAVDVVRRLGTKRHARLLVDLAELVESDASGAASAKPGRTVRDRAGSTVWAAFERFRSAASDLEGADIEALHDARIMAKRLRYTLEFLAPVLGADRDWLIARLVDVQDHLGALNDADLAATATRSFLDEPADITDAQRAAIEAYADARAAMVEELRAATPKVVASSVSAAFARRLSRAVLGPSA